jgi:TatA/E family protein of Tat protein translocase
MFGSLGVPELLLIFAVILIVFGPRRIPEIGRTLGKALGEFRKATDDLKSTIEREVRLEELKKITPPTLESFTTPFESVSRSEPGPVGEGEQVVESPSLRVDEAQAEPGEQSRPDSSATDSSATDSSPTDSSATDSSATDSSATDELAPRRLDDSTTRRLASDDSTTRSSTT